MSALLRTKLSPPRRCGRLLRREPLLRQLAAGLGRQLTLVSAPAGFGKSTLVSTWAAEQPAPVAWLALDPHDNDPARFWAYVCAALQAAAGLSLAPGEPGEAGLADLINGLAAAPGPLVLVLDDYHLITNPAVHRQLAFLIDHQPPQLHLVIVTRADPPLPLARLRAHGLMHEIRVVDLRLSLDETRAFFGEVVGLKLVRDDIEALAGRIEGWLAGLQLAALSLQRPGDARGFIDQFSGRQQYVMEYLTEEVLARLPAEVYTFLLATSLLDQLTAPLCDALLETTGSQGLLLSLHADNLFLFALDETRTWFRYHHLFAELLRARFVQTRGEAARAALLGRAAAWCEAQRLVEPAIGYALAAGDVARAARLVEDHWQHLLHRGEIQLLQTWLDALPAAAYARSAPLNMARAWALSLAGQMPAVPELLRRTRAAWAAHTPETPPARNSWLAMPSLIETLAAIVAMHEQRPRDALAHAQQALARIPDDPGFDGAALLRGAAAYRLAHAQRALGDPQAAAATLQAVFDDLLAGGNTVGLARTLADLSDLWERAGRASDALDLCARALAYVESRGEADLPLAGTIYAATAVAHARAGDPARAVACLERAEELGRRGNQQALQIAARARAGLRAGQPLAEPLSEREIEVLALICRGLSNQQIAAELHIALSTVKKHSGSIFGKLGVTSRTQAILQAQARGLIGQVD